MGKIIPPGAARPAIAVSAAAVTEQLGVLEHQAREFREQLGRAEQIFDLDELDHIARRYARHPASGCSEALEALALVARCLPEHFSRTEVNLDPGRLDSLADRYRALGALSDMLPRFTELVKDSHHELGDEAVELLTVGWMRTSGVSADQLLGNERLARAVSILSDYHQRVADECAHRSTADHAPAAKHGHAKG